MAFYDRVSRKAAKMIARYGRTTGITLVAMSTPTIRDPTKPWETTATESSESCTAVVIHYDEKLIDGTTIQRGDRQVIVAALGLNTPPNLNGAAVIDGVRYKIVNVQPLEPGGQALIYTLQVRQ